MVKWYKMLKIFVLFLVFVFVQSDEISVENVVVWTAGKAVDVTLGPKDAVYCKLRDNKDNWVYNGFGPCRIVLDRVTMDHKGLWKIYFMMPGTLMYKDHTFSVDVPADSKPVVTTNVIGNGSLVTLTCSVPAEYEVQACIFREPRDEQTIHKVIATEAGQNGYISGYVHFWFYSLFSSTKLINSECSCSVSKTANAPCSVTREYSGLSALLQLRSRSSRSLLHSTSLNAFVGHQGIWRCAVKTARNIRYGFLTLTMSMLEVSGPDYHRTEPVLKSEHKEIESMEGDPVTMSCSIDAAIHYCYFRAENGTIYNVGPSTSSAGYKYAGNGFDAGECGIRFNSIWAFGRWSCHVGLTNTFEEQKDFFNVTTFERMTVHHGWLNSSAVWVIFSIQRAYDQLEYCRLVRFDGLGFTSDSVPPQYDLHVSKKVAYCMLIIPHPISEDLLPWTVVVKLIGENGELSITSNNTLSPTPPTREPSKTATIHFWTFFGMFCLLVTLAAVSLIPKKNRERTYQRAAHIRNSLRKPPLPVHTDTELPRKV